VPVGSFGRRRFVVVRSMFLVFGMVSLVVFPLAAFMAIAITQSLEEVLLLSMVLFLPCWGLGILGAATCVVAPGYVRPVRVFSRRVGVEELKSLSVDVKRESVVASLVDGSTVALLSCALAAAGSQENLTRILNEAKELIEQEARLEVK